MDPVDEGRTLYALAKGEDRREIDGAIADVLAYEGRHDDARRGAAREALGDRPLTSSTGEAAAHAAPRTPVATEMDLG